MSTLKIKGQTICRLNGTDLIGEGAFGTVYTYKNDDTRVIKVFKDTNSFPEAEFAAQLSAYNAGLAAKPLSVGWTDDYKYEYLEMERVYPSTKDGFSKDELAKMLEDVAAKLILWHQSGWCHRDIARPTERNHHIIGGKWDNIWLTKSGVVLLDYGMAISSDNSFDEEEFGADCRQDLIDLNDWFGEMLIK